MERGHAGLVINKLSLKGHINVRYRASVHALVLSSPKFRYLLSTRESCMSFDSPRLKSLLMTCLERNEQEEEQAEEEEEGSSRFASASAGSSFVLGR